MKLRYRPPVVSLLIDEERLRCWLAEAKTGGILEYHRGVLAIDRQSNVSRLAERHRRELDRVANIVCGLADANRGYLLQRRYGDGDYSYLFIHRSTVLPVGGLS